MLNYKSSVLKGQAKRRKKFPLKKEWTLLEGYDTIIKRPESTEVFGKPGRTFWTLTTEQQANELSAHLGDLNLNSTKEFRLLEDWDQNSRNK